jgi:hypothetical protein
MGLQARRSLVAFSARGTGDLVRKGLISCKSMASRPFWPSRNQGRAAWEAEERDTDGMYLEEVVQLTGQGTSPSANGAAVFIFVVSISVAGVRPSINFHGFDVKRGTCIPNLHVLS